MVHTPIQKCPVMGNQDKSFLFHQIITDQLPPLCIQVVGGLVNEQKAVFPQKQGRQQYLGPLPITQGGEGAVQHILRQLQKGEFPQQSPGLQHGIHPLQHIYRQILRILHRIGEILKFHTGVNTPLIGKFPHQQTQKRRFPAAVAPNKSKAPVGIHLKADILKNRPHASLIGKAQIRNRNQRQKKHPFTQKNRAAEAFSSAAPIFP